MALAKCHTAGARSASETACWWRRQAGVNEQQLAFALEQDCLPRALEDDVAMTLFNE
jgi:hypothetical protein